MSLDQRAGGHGAKDDAVPAGAPAVEPAARGDRPIAPADPRGHELLLDLRLRLAELDAIAWNLPGRRQELLAPPDSAWPEASGRTA
jgi:hypothetical protein